jgi:hypothetical protein
MGEIKYNKNKKTGRQLPDTTGNGNKVYWKPMSTMDCST